MLELLQDKPMPVRELLSAPSLGFFTRPRCRCWPDLVLGCTEQFNAGLLDSAQLIGSASRVEGLSRVPCAGS